MRNNSRISFVLTKYLARTATYILVGAGALAFLLAQPTLAQSDRLEISPNSQPRRDRRPTTQVEAGDYEIKEDKLRRCVVDAASSQKNCTDVAAGYAQILSFGNDISSRGNLAVAETIFREMVRVFPKEATPHLKLGIVLERQGKLEAATTQYRQVLEINSDHAVARNFLGVALAKQGQLQEAMTQWRQALTINAEYADAMTNLGLGFLQQGNETEAAANLKKARELFIRQREFQKARQVEEVLQQIEAQAT